MIDRHLSIKEVGRLCGASAKTITRWVERGDFPKPITISGAKRWIETEVQQYLWERKKERDAAEAARQAAESGRRK